MNKMYAEKPLKDLLEEYVRNGFIESGEEKISFDRFFRMIKADFEKGKISKFDLGDILIELESSSIYLWNQTENKEQLERIARLKKYFFGV